MKVQPVLSAFEQIVMPVRVPNKKRGQRKRKAAPMPSMLSMPSMPVSNPGSKQSKRDRNKISASKYRKRRKMYFDGLESKIAVLEGTVGEQTQTIEALHNSNQELKEQVMLFQKLFRLYGFEGRLPTDDSSENSDSSCPSSPSSLPELEVPTRLRTKAGLVMFALFACLMFISPGLSPEDNPYKVTSHRGRALMSFDGSPSSAMADLGENFWDDDLYKQWSQPGNFAQKQKRTRPAKNKNIEVEVGSDEELLRFPGFLAGPARKFGGKFAGKFEPRHKKRFAKLPGSLNPKLSGKKFDAGLKLLVDNAFMPAKPAEQMVKHAELVASQIQELFSTVSDDESDESSGDDYKQATVDEIFIKSEKEAEYANSRLFQKPTTAEQLDASTEPNEGSVDDEVLSWVRKTEEAYQYALTSFVDQLDNSTTPTGRWSTGSEEEEGDSESDLDFTEDVHMFRPIPPKEDLLRPRVDRMDQMDLQSATEMLEQMSRDLKKLI